MLCRNTVICAITIGLLATPALADSLGPDTEPADARVRVGGYIQPGLTIVENSVINDDDANGFEFANARLTGTAEYAVGANMRARFNFNFDVNQGNFLVRDVYGSLTFKHEQSDLDLGLDVGQLKTPFSLAQIQSEARMQFARSSGIRALAFGRDQGMQARAKKRFGVVVAGLWLMMANGEGGFRQRRNADNQFIYVARTEVSIKNEVPLDEPDLDRGDLAVTIGFGAGYTPELGAGLGIGDVGAEETRLGGDVRVHFRGISSRAEGIWADRGSNDVGDGFNRFGVHWQIGYVLPIAANGVQFEPAFRFFQLDINDADDGGFDMSRYVIDNTERRIFELGFNTYFAEHDAKASIAYQRTDMLEGPIIDPDGGPLVGDALLLFFQLARL